MVDTETEHLHTLPTAHGIGDPTEIDPPSFCCYFAGRPAEKEGE